MPRLILVALSAGLLSAGLLSAGLLSASPATESSIANAPRTYLVSFIEPALLEVNANALKAGVQAKSLSAAKAANIQNLHLAKAAQALKTDLIPSLRLIWTNNAVALTLTSKAAAALASQPGIESVEIEFTGTLQTDTGPTFIGAQALWAATVGQSGNRGAGVVVGIIDSGINASHPSFAATASDGYQHSNPRGQRFGLCNSLAAARCSDKLIGIYDFTDEGSKDGGDLDGHGTHVASTAIGNPFAGRITAPTISFPVPISGVAPRSNVISYKACSKSATGPTTCPGAALLSAIEQAAADGVQVVNYSIGGSARDPFAALNFASDIRAMFNARAAGVVFSVSAGNDGPAPGSMLSPANAPWVLAVASITHDRLLLNTLGNLSGSTPAPKLAFDGVGLSAGLVDRAIVLGETFGNRFCSQGTNSDSPPTGVSNPFAPGTFNGQIVVCERGTQARVAKSFNVRAAGAGGMILINTTLEGESIVADSHYLPTVHLGQIDGALLRNWLQSSSNTRGSISGTESIRSPNLGDVLNNSSSRGPVAAGVMKPDIAAPGTDILAADLATGIQPLTGTSMAAPHVAGALALLRALHPNWGVDEIESAVRTSALPGVVREAGSTNAASIAQAGAGRLQANVADQARLYLPLNNSDLRLGAANPSALNLPSMLSNSCKSRCTFTRTVKASSDMQGRGSWSATLINAAPGLILAMRPAQFSIGAGESQTLNFDVDVSNPLFAGQELATMVELRASGFSSLRLPLSVRADPGTVPDALNFSVTSERGQINTQLSGLITLPRPSAQLSEFTKVTTESANILGNTGTPFNDTTNGTLLRLVTIDQVGGQFWAKAADASGRDLDLFLGRDANNDGLASVNELLCRKDGSASAETCRIDVKAAGRYWLLVQIASTNSVINPSVSMEYASIAAVTILSTRANFAALPGKTPQDAAFPITLAYDLGGSVPGEDYIATLALRADSAAAMPMSTTLVRLSRAPGAETPLVLQNQRTEDIFLAGGSIRSKISFSVPAGASRVDISISNASTSPTDVVAEIVRAAANESMLIGVTSDAPAIRVATFSNGAANITLSGSELTPGRYYLRLKNSNNVPGASPPPSVFTKLKLNITTSGNAPSLAPELYYNPARSGHGLIVTRAGADAQFIWYTFDHTGQPTWYLFLPTGYYANNPAIVTGPLLRSTWDGSKGSGGQAVGNASITRTGTNEFVFDFSLLGESGSERMQFLGASGCISGNNVSTPTDFTGLWYQPSTSGWGASVHIAPGLEFVPFFIYDALGQPRWVLGNHSAPTLANSAPATNPLTQLFGFCPTCSYTVPTQRATGSYSLKMDALPRFTADITGVVTLDANLQAPLVGSFRQSGDFALLTGKKSCTP